MLLLDRIYLIIWIFVPFLQKGTNQIVLRTKAQQGLGAFAHNIGFFLHRTRSLIVAIPLLRIHPPIGLGQQMVDREGKIRGISGQAYA
jgi:hypothetical protein